MPARISSWGIAKPLERVMAFIDGGYLRQLCKKTLGHDNINWLYFRQDLIHRFNVSGTPFNANLIRIYYYDAIVPKTHPRYEKDNEYFEKIRKREQYTVRLGVLVESSKGSFKQKGVDILISIDSLTKAYQNHYETGIFLMGDGDFAPLITAIKDSGKKTLLVSSPGTVSPELTKIADMRLYFSTDKMKDWLEKE